MVNVPLFAASMAGFDQWTVKLLINLHKQHLGA